MTAIMPPGRENGEDQGVFKPFSNAFPLLLLAALPLALQGCAARVVLVMKPCLPAVHTNGSGKGIFVAVFQDGRDGSAGGSDAGLRVGEMPRRSIRFLGVPLLLDAPPAAKLRCAVKGLVDAAGYRPLARAPDPFDETPTLAGTLRRFSVENVPGASPWEVVAGMEFELSVLRHGETLLTRDFEAEQSAALGAGGFPKVSDYQTATDRAVEECLAQAAAFIGTPAFSDAVAGRR